MLDLRPILIPVVMMILLAIALGFMSTLHRKTSEDLQSLKVKYETLQNDYTDLFTGVTKRGYIKFTLTPPLVSDWVETEEQARSRLSKINHGDKDAKYHGENK